MTTFSSEQFAAGVAAALCVVAVVIVMLFVPRTTKDPTRIAASDSKENKMYGEGGGYLCSTENTALWGMGVTVCVWRSYEYKMSENCTLTWYPYELQ